MAKTSQNPLLLGFMPLWLFKVIDVGTPEKLVNRACYDKQQLGLGVYLQLFSRYIRVC